MQLKNIIALLAGLISVVSCIPYIIDIAKDKTHPNLVSWGTWLLVSIINTAAAISTGAFHTSILSGAIVLTDAAIVVMGIRRGVKSYTKFDIICQVLAILGVILWLATGNPSLAVLLSLTVILIAALPTWRHAWRLPYEETWQGFGMAIAASTLTLASVEKINFIALAYPISTFVNCSVIVFIILTRRKCAIMPAVTR
jgi:hypothetical protein